MNNYYFLLLSFVFLISCVDKKEEAKNLVRDGIKKNLNSDFNNALIDLTKAIEYDNSNPDAYFYRGNVKSNLNDYKGAVIDYGKAIELNPSFADAYYNRGNIRFMQGDKVGACADYKKAEKFGKDNIRDNTRWCE
jgi:tetratricopeptide (TPR) repeat protein